MRKLLASAVLVLLSACAATHDAPRAPGAEPLAVVGRQDVMEVGPVLHAVRAVGPETAAFTAGGVDNLFKEDGAPAGTGAFDFAAGGAEIAAQAETQALRASVANPDLRIVLTITEGVYSIVARRSAGIAALADLRGKRIAVFERTSAAYFLHRMLATAGLSEADVAIVPMRPREMEPALAARRVDAIAIWEPESERARATLGSDLIAFEDAEAYRELYNLNTTAQVLADPARRAKLVAFVRVLLDSIRVAREDPAQIWPLVAANSGYDAALVAASWKYHRFPGTLPADLVDVLVAEEQWLAAQDGRTPRSRDELARLVDPTILAEALR